jgi:hypothetical protein
MLISQPATAMAEMTKFLSQIATLWPGRHRTISYEEPAAQTYMRSTMRADESARVRQEKT